MKLAVVGSGGRLGAALARSFRDRHDVTGFDHYALDLDRPDEIESCFRKIDFDVLINAAAVTNVDYCETNEEEAYTVNARAPGVLAHLCRSREARMIQISTDYVFDGEAEGLISESDAPNPQSIYGKSKLEGEEAVLEVSGDFLVVRTSWVFGPDRRSFLDSIVERAMNLEGVEAIEDKISTPSYSLDFADMLDPFLEKIVEGGHLNLCNGGACSWLEYGQLGVDCVAEAGISLKTKKLHGIPLAKMDRFVASRPRLTAMSMARYEKLAKKKARPWQDAVRAYMEHYFVPRQRSETSG